MSMPSPHGYVENEEDPDGMYYYDTDGNLRECDGGQSCDGSCPGWS